MAIYCFDTSAINSLHDDVERENIVQGLLATNRTYVTALNIIEACGTESQDRRRSLISLLRKLSGRYRPLAFPNKILQTFAIAHAKGDDQAVITITKQQDGIWVALNKPFEVDEGIRQEAFKWKSEIEKHFRAAHRKARKPFEKLFKTGSSPRIRKVSTLIRYYMENPEFLYHNVVGPIYMRSTAVELPFVSSREFLSNMPTWQLFLIGWAHAIFNQAIKENGYSPKKNPGSIDLWCAVYLCFCDFFITNDRAQHQALRLVNTFNPRKTRIFSYQNFRKRLLIG